MTFCFFEYFYSAKVQGSKVTVKTFVTLQTISVLNKCCTFELSIHQRALKNIYHGFFTKILSSTKVLCDTEDESNYAENSDLYPGNKLHFKMFSFTVFLIKSLQP